MRKISLLLLLLFVFGCKSKEPENITVIDENPLRYLALGDSYTIGESVEIPLRWPMQLVRRLKTEGFDIEEPRIIARTGWTTQNLLEAMNLQLNNEKFDLVSVLIGVNNQYQNKPIEAYEKDLHTIFNRALEHSKYGAAGIFAVSIPDYGATPFGAENAEQIEKELDEFNRVFRRVASEYDIDFFDITPISRSATADATLIAEDGLHPSGKMYKLWVDHFYEKVKEKLKQKD